MTLFKQYFRVQRTGLIIWAGGTALLGWVLAATVKPMELGDALTKFIQKVAIQLPPGLQALFGMVPGMSSVDSLIQAKMGFWLAVAMPIYACLLAVSAMTREIDRGTADFLLALPVDRRQVLISRWAVMVTDLSVFALAAWAALCAGLKATGVQGNFSGYFWMIAQIWFLSVAVGSLAMLGSMWSSDYETAIKWALGAVGVLFVTDFGLRVVEVPLVWRFFNPFAYYDTLQPILRNSLMWGDAAVLAGISIVSLVLAVRVLDARQIHS